jgi:hypothetical protein
LVEGNVLLVEGDAISDAIITGSTGFQSASASAQVASASHAESTVVPRKRHVAPTVGSYR